MTSIGRTWELWACRYESGTFMHVGARRWVELHYLPEPIVPVLVEEVLGDPLAPEVTHYAWEDTDRPRASPAMVQRRAHASPGIQRSAWMLLDMCFPYGVKAEVDAGRGKILALRITERADVATP